MSSGKPRRPAPRYRHWFIETLEDRSAPSDSLLLLGALAAAVQTKPADVAPGAVNAEVAEMPSFAPTRGTSALFISRADPAPSSTAPPLPQDTVGTEAADQFFTTEFVNLSAELSLGGNSEDDSPGPARASARPLSTPSGTNSAPAPGGTAGSSGSGGGGGGGGAGVDGAAAAMAASASAAAAAPTTSAHSTTTASTADNSVMRTSVSRAGYVPPPPVANDDDLDTYHDTPLIETDPGIVENDDPNIQSCVLDTGPSMGQISNWDGQGGFTYTPNYHVYGTDTFTYHNVDYYGQSSNEATVTIHVVENAPEALPDGTYWGDWNKLSTSGNTITVDAANGVLANDTDQDGPDSGNLQAVLDTDPTNGSLTLNPDGSFIYTPNPGFGGYDQFTYHATDGILNSATVAVALAVEKVDLDIWDGGPDGQAVPDAKENTRGAYTVVNQNDTNGDGTPDYAQYPVVSIGSGRDEVDLMKLVINKPEPWTNGDTLELDFTANKLSLWTDQVKSDPYPSANGVASIKTDNWPVTLWVEALAGSQSLRDMTISAQYNGGTDSVAVTGIWAKLTLGSSDTLNAATVTQDFNDMDPDLQQYIGIFGGTGLTPPKQAVGIRNAILLQFTIMPPRNGDGTWEGDSVFFDATRQMERRSYKGTPFQLDTEADFPTVEEVANDDTHDDDESSAVTPFGHFYSYDPPGYRTLTPDSSQREVVYNFREFMRVDIDGARPTGAGPAGSRCSDYYPWYARIDVVNVGGQWQRDPNKQNANIVGVGGPIDLSAF